MRELPVFDYRSMIAALDARRAEHGLGWNELAGELWGNRQTSMPDWRTTAYVRARWCATRSGAGR